MFRKKYIVGIISIVLLTAIFVCLLKVMTPREKYVIGKVECIEDVLNPQDFTYMPYSILVIVCEETNGNDFQIGDVIDVPSRTINGEPYPGKIFKQYVKVYYGDYIKSKNHFEITEVISFENLGDNIH